MASQVKSGKEFSVAIGAVEFLVTDVYLNVFIKVGSLSEFLGAAVVGARERAFAGVHAQMVEEVVPLAELLPASVLTSLGFHIALEDLDHSLSKWVLRREDEEIFGLWNVLHVLDLVG